MVPVHAAARAEPHFPWRRKVLSERAWRRHGPSVGLRLGRGKLRFDWAANSPGTAEPETRHAFLPPGLRTGGGSLFSGPSRLRVSSLWASLPLQRWGRGRRHVRQLPWRPELRFPWKPAGLPRAWPQAVGDGPAAAETGSRWGWRDVGRGAASRDSPCPPAEEAPGAARGHEPRGRGGEEGPAREEPAAGRRPPPATTAGSRP